MGRNEVSLMSRGGMDADRCLVWLLVLLLLQNGASLELILALFYVAMG